MAGVLGVGGSLAATACTASNAPAATIDGAKLEQNIVDDASKTDLKLSRVDCPRDRVARANDRFACTATLVEGGTLTYDVAITSERGEYTYQLAPGQVLDGTEAARLITADIAAAGPTVPDATVTCPASVVAPTAKTVFACTLHVSGSSAVIDVTNERGLPLDWQYAAP